MTFERAFTSLILLGGISLFGASCSQQNRTSEVGVDSAAIQTQFDSAVGLMAASSTQATNVRALFESENTEVYYATSKGSMGTPASLLALYDYVFLANDLESVKQITEVHVFFLDQLNPDFSRNTALIFDVSYTANGGAKRVVRTFTQPENQEVEVGLNSYDVLLSDTVDTELRVTTKDYQNDSMKLRTVIQLSLDLNEPSTGTEGYLGRITTLVGFVP